MLFVIALSCIAILILIIGGNIAMCSHKWKKIGTFLEVISDLMIVIAYMMMSSFVFFMYSQGFGIVGGTFIVTMCIIRLVGSIRAHEKVYSNEAKRFAEREF